MLRPTFLVQILLKTTYSHKSYPVHRYGTCTIAEHNYEAPVWVADNNTIRSSHPVHRYGTCTIAEHNYEASVWIADNNTIRSANAFGRVPYR